MLVLLGIFWLFCVQRIQISIFQANEVKSKEITREIYATGNCTSLCGFSLLTVTWTTKTNAARTSKSSSHPPRRKQREIFVSISNAWRSRDDVMLSWFIRLSSWASMQFGTFRPRSPSVIMLPPTSMPPRVWNPNPGVFSSKAPAPPACSWHWFWAAKAEWCLGPISRQELAFEVDGAIWAVFPSGLLFESCLFLASESVLVKWKWPWWDWSTALLHLTNATTERWWSRHL